MPWRLPFGRRTETEGDAAAGDEIVPEGWVDVDEDPIVYLATVPNEPMASFWTEVLDEAGIRTLVKPVGAGIGGWASAATLEHELHVLRSRLGEARAMMGDG
jgi:hypothetical protein